MKRTLVLTPESAYQTFRDGHLGFLVPKGLLMLKVPHDLTSCVLVTRTHDTLWKGHAESPEGLELMAKTEAFALIERKGIDNPFNDIDFSDYDGSFTIPARASDLDFGSYPQVIQEQSAAEVSAFLSSRIGYRVHNGILKLTEPDDPDSCVLEVHGHVMWYGNALSDEAHNMIEKSTEIIALTPDPVFLKPLQA